MSKQSWQECRRKKRYRSQSEASRALGRLLVNGDQRGTERAHVYECPHCGGHHVGRQKKERMGVAA